MKHLLDLKFHEATDAKGVPFQAMSATLRFSGDGEKVDTINARFNIGDAANKDIAKVKAYIIKNMLDAQTEANAKDASVADNLKAISVGDFSGITSPNRKMKRAITKIKKKTK